MRRQTTADALAQLERHQVVAGRINDIADVLDDPHVAARDAIATLLDGELGPVRMPAPVPRLSATPGSIRWAGARMGAQNDEIFTALLAGALDRG